MKRPWLLLDRLVPAALLAAGVTLLTAGLLSYVPSAFGEWQTSEPDLAAGDPLFTEQPTSHVTDPAPGPTADPPRTPGSTPVPLTSPSPSPRPTDPVEAPRSPEPADPVGFASRIRIASLGIDLPVVSGDLVVRGNRDLYPLCDVAMYTPEFVQPGEPGATYIYAHAQRGMFAPLLKASQVNDGRQMLGALVEVYTTENELHLYEISRVKRHATDLSITNVGPGEHILVLQTSEGPTGTIPKLQVAARPLSVVPASRSDANPRPRPRVCLPN